MAATFTTSRNLERACLTALPAVNVVDLWICGRLAGSSVAQIALGDDVVHEAWPFGQETSLDMFFGALLLIVVVGALLCQGLIRPLSL